MPGCCSSEKELLHSHAFRGRIVEIREKRAMEIANMATAMLAGDVETVINEALDYFDDLDNAVDFFIDWRRGSLLGLEPGQRTDRWGVTVRLQELIEQDLTLREEILRHPRYLVALAIQEATGVRIIAFLSQVKSVRIVEEEPGVHWLVLPECHHGCEIVANTTAHEERDSCQVCGNPQGGCSRKLSNPTTNRDRIHAIDDEIIRMHKADPTLRERLKTDSLGVFTQVAFTMYGVRPQEEFGIHAVNIGNDSETSIDFVLLARHDSRKTPVVDSEKLRRVSLIVD